MPPATSVRYSVRWVLIALVVIPLVELFLLIQIDRLIGLGPTIAMTLVTGLVGGTLARREGSKVWRAWKKALEEMSTPEQGVIDGVLVLLGGALLITPGVLTDVMGFSLLIPFSRRRVARQVRAMIDRKLASGTVSVFSSGSTDAWGSSEGPWSAPSPGGVVDTEGSAVSDVEPSAPDLPRLPDRDA